MINMDLITIWALFKLFSYKILKLLLWPAWLSAFRISSFAQSWDFKTSIGMFSPIPALIKLLFLVTGSFQSLFSVASMILSLYGILIQVNKHLSRICDDILSL